MARTGCTGRGSRGTRGIARPAVVTAAVALALAACTDDGDSAPTTLASTTTTTVVERVDDGRLVLGVYLPRTGPGAVLGEPMIAAVEDAVAEINAAGGVLDDPVELVVFDENSDATMEDLLARGVDAIVGPASSTVALSQLDDIVGVPGGVVTCSPSATALALDDYPDNGLFFRTVPSDSLQMTAIAIRAAQTGVGSVAVAYLDDTYGRGLRNALRREAAARSVVIATQVPIPPGLEDLRQLANEALAAAPGVIVVLGDADDAARLLPALDAATTGTPPPQIIVNDALRNARQTVQTLSEPFRARLVGVAPQARAAALEVPGFFTGHAIDCVNLIALATVQAKSDAPKAIQTQMAAVSASGSPCDSFASCVAGIEGDLQIDYNGRSGAVDLSSTTGDVTGGWFEVFSFDEEGIDVTVEAAGDLLVS